MQVLRGSDQIGRQLATIALLPQIAMQNKYTEQFVSLSKLKHELFNYTGMHRSHRSQPTRQAPVDG